METYKKKHQHKTKVTEGFIKKITKRIMLRLLKREKNDLKNQEFNTLITSQEHLEKYHENHNKEIPKTGYRFFCAFISQHQNTSEDFKEYFLYFLLYYDQYIPKNMSITAALMLGYSVTRFNDWTEKIEEQRQKHIQKHCSPKKNTTPKQEERMTANLKSTKKKYESLSSRDFKRTNLLPSTITISQIIGINSKKIAYGIRKITGMMKKTYEIYTVALEVTKIKGLQHLLK